jgi:hypothetical protein
MHRSTRSTILLAVIAALIAVVAVAGVATAANSDATTAAKKKKKKPLFTAKQTKQINKLIAAKIATIPPVKIPAGPAAYLASNGAEIALDNGVGLSTPVLSKALPAGKYVVSGHVNGFYLTDSAADEAQLVCRAKVNGNILQSTSASNDAGIFILVASAGTLNIPFNFTVDAAAASTFTVDCSAGFDNPGAYTGVTINAGAAKFTATTVSSIG